VARYSTGQPIRLSTTVKDVTGTLVNPGALTLTVLKPDATQQVYSSPANDGTGLLHQDIPIADLGQVGHYAYKWTSTGTGAGESAGDFDVFDPFEPAVLPLQDAKDALNIPASVTTSDNEIAAFVATIETCLERMTGGPLVNRTITAERAEMMAGQTVICVRQRPLVSVTSITSASGGAIDISAGLDIDVNAGTIRRKLGLPFYGPFFSWLPQVLVTYVAGWGTAVPAAFGMASRIIIQNLWETQHGPSARPSMGGGDEMVTLPGFGFAIPNQAAELLDGSQNGIPFMTEAFV
jgi:hypothetical protein